MHPKQEQISDSNFKKYVPNVSTHSIHSLPPLPNTLKKDFQNIMQFQNKRFNEMNHSCQHLQQTIMHFEDIVDKLQTRTSKVAQSSESETISHLKIKQSQFIISELRGKIKKNQANQENNRRQNLELMKEIEKFKNKIASLDFNNKILTEQIKNLQKIINQKNQQLQSSAQGKNISQSISFDKNKQKLNISSQQLNSSSQKYKHQYRILEDRLLELQEQFNTKMTELTKECELKNKQIQNLKIQLQSEKKQKKKLQSTTISKNISINNEVSSVFSGSSSIMSYQNEIKLKQQLQINKELQDSYNKLLSSSSKNQIGLHQQLHQLKIQATQQKKTNKKYKKHIIQNLQGLTNWITKKNYSYFSSNQPTEQIDQIKKIFDKVMIKVQQQLKMANLQIQQLKKTISEKQIRMRQLQFAEKQLQHKTNDFKSRKSSLKKDKGSLNGSFGSKNFDNKSQVSSTTNYQQKYRILIQNLKNDNKMKQIIISDLQKAQYQQFEKSKSKILALQTEISQKRNLIKKLQRQIKQNNQDGKKQYVQLQNLTQSLKQRIEKLQKDKQVAVFSYAQRIKVLQQKLRMSKDNFKQIQSRSQDKIVKYNKLKQKYQKLQLVCNQTQKRKSVQIEELIKKNQTLKIENKILTQKIQLNQLVQIVPGHIQNSQTPYNKDLIQQIQMQRDRILLDFQDKCKQLKKIKIQNDKLQKENAKLQISIKQIQSQQQILKDKHQICQKKNRQIAILQNQNIILKQEVLDSKNSLQDKNNLQYIHLRNQLEKATTNFKKLQKQSKSQGKKLKYHQQNQERLNSQFKTVKHQLQWNKQKVTKHKAQLQKIKSDNDRQLKNCYRKLSEAAIKQQSLVNIINYKNNNSEQGQIRQSMQREEPILIQKKQKSIANIQNLELVQAQTNTNNIQTLNNQTMTLLEVQVKKEKNIGQNFKIIQIQSITIYERNANKLIKQIHFKLVQSQAQTQFENLQNPSYHKKYSNQLKEKRRQEKLVNILQDQLLGSYHSEQENFKNQNDINRQDLNDLNQNMEQRMVIRQLQQQVDNNQNNNFQIINDKKKQNFENQIQVNLFQNLGIDEGNLDDNFQICEQGESINVGQTTLNLHIRQIFNKLRLQLEKVFNGQEISMSMMKILPRQLEDDYNQFISYIREKIMDIKSQNQLSFIMAEIGDQPQEVQQIDEQLQNFIQKRVSEDIYTYKKMLYQKQSLINSLINEKTMQQNTINQMTFQKEQIQQQNQNRFMNQCNVYKKQIKELKKHLDQLQMNFMSMKNIFKNIMEIWIDSQQNQDDFIDNLQIYGKIAKLNQKQSTRLNYYVDRYRQMKINL